MKHFHFAIFPMKLTTITALFFLFVTFTQAQSNRGCGTESYHADKMLNDPGYAASFARVQQQVDDYLRNHSIERSQMVVDIPVVFHVVYSTAAQNISTARILEQLDVLNQDFHRMNPDSVNTPAPFQVCAVSTGINFCLAVQDPNGQSTTGILTIPTTVTSFTQNDAVKFTGMGGHDAWNTSEYMNIWICNMATGNGYSSYPGGNAALDGIVLDFETVGGPTNPGTVPPFHLGRNLTHMTGHYLNLAHLTINCDSILADYCQPVQQSIPFGCPTFPSISCNNGPNGDMFMNYMQYVDDNCMNLFNNFQSARMMVTMSMLRSSLSGSVGCDPVGISEINPLNDFNIMPNPFSDYLNIESRNGSEVELRMIDVSGRTVLEQRFTHKISVNTQGLAKGVYYLELISGDQKKIERIVRY